MSLRYALLGLLVRESLSGYDLTKKFESSVGSFWNAKHSQIYPELAQLADLGLVTFEVIAQTSKPNKKIYTITPDGRQALEAWVNAPGSEKSALKNSLLIRVWTVGELDPEPLIPTLREALQEQEQRLAVLQGIMAEAEAKGETVVSPQNTMLGPLMTLRCGIMQGEFYRNWLTWALEQLETLSAARRENAAQPAS